MLTAPPAADRETTPQDRPRSLASLEWVLAHRHTQRAWRRPASTSLRALIGAVAVGAFYSSVTWGLSPVSPLYRNGYWPLDPSVARQVRLQHAVTLPGPDDAVSAVYYVVPHLTHRSAIYTFPNPWKQSNWGVAGENGPDPDGVDWLIVDPSAITGDERPLLAAVLADPDRSLTGMPTDDEDDEAYTPALVETVHDPAAWELVVNQPNLLVAHRVR